MANNQNPLEKVFLPMDLSGGLDERVRPEVGGDQAKTITRLENLLQDETGGWVKRPGLEAILSSNNDELGSGVDAVRKIIPLHDGLGVIAGGHHELLHLHEETSLLRRKGYAQYSRVEAIGVGSTQKFRSESNAARVLSIASSTKYEVVAYEDGTNVIVVYERESGSQVAKYALGGTTSAYVGMAFVGTNDRYLHVYMAYSGALYYTSIDTGASGTTWPTSQTLSLTTHGSLTPSFIWDIASYGDVSIIVMGTVGAYARDTLGNEYTNTTYDYYSVDIDGTYAWLVGDDGGGQFSAEAVGYADIGAAATYSWTDGSVVTTGYGNYAAVDSTGKLHVVLYDSSQTFGTGVISKMLYYQTTDPTDTALTYRAEAYGWDLASLPFVNKNTNKCYIHLQKQVSQTDYSTPRMHCVANLSGYVRTQWQSAPTYIYSFPLEAVLEPFNGAYNVRQMRYQQIYGTDGHQFSLVLPYVITSRATSIGVYKLYQASTKALEHAEFGGSTYITGGNLCSYDGATITDQSFADMPVLDINVSGGASLTGSFNYLAVYRYLDAQSNVHYSRVSDITSVTITGKNPVISAQGCHVTRNDTGLSNDHRVIIDVYRTTNGGTQYYLLCSTQDGYSSPMVLAAAAKYFTFTDNVSDATLATRPILYRQPGTDGTAVDRYAAPPSDIICQHKDRLFVTDAYRKNVCYSSFHVDGEGAWFNPIFSLQPQGGTGPITSMASMDGRLFVFKRDAIFVIDGDGPPENGGSGAEFSPPARIATTYGCIDHRSMVVTGEGIVYRSRRGIEMLTRSMQVVWIGDRVQNTVDDYPYTTCAFVDSAGRTRVFLSDYDMDDTSQQARTGVGMVLDMSGGQPVWSVEKYKVGGSSAQDAVRSVAMYNSSSGDIYAYAMYGTSGLWKPSTSSYLDNGTFVPWLVETGDIRPSGTQVRFRLFDVNVLGKRSTNHGLKVSLAYDFEDYEQSETWQPDALKKTLVEVKVQPKKPTPVSFRVKIEDSQPTDTTAYAVGSGKGMDLLGIGFWIGMKSGPQQVAPFRKG